MYQPSDANYANGPRDGSYVMYRSLNSTVADEATMALYKKEVADLPETTIGRGVVGKGLIIKRTVYDGDPIIEYTGNRVSGINLLRMEQALDHFNEDPEGFVLVDDENMFIDPRKVGNDAQYVYQFCNPNAELREVRVGDMVIVMIVALRRIRTKEEVCVDYG